MEALCLRFVSYEDVSGNQGRDGGKRQRAEIFKYPESKIEASQLVKTLGKHVSESVHRICKDTGCQGIKCLATNQFKRENYEVLEIWSKAAFQCGV